MMESSSSTSSSSLVEKESCKQVEEINISHNRLKPKHITELIKAIENGNLNKLKRVILSYNSVLELGCMYLANW